MPDNRASFIDTVDCRISVYTEHDTESIIKSAIVWAYISPGLQRSKITKLFPDFVTYFVTYLSHSRFRVGPRYGADLVISGEGVAGRGLRLAIEIKTFCPVGRPTLLHSAHASYTAMTRTARSSCIVISRSSPRYIYWPVSRSPTNISPSLSSLHIYIVIYVFTQCFVLYSASFGDHEPYK